MLTFPQDKICDFCICQNIPIRFATMVWKLKLCGVAVQNVYGDIWAKFIVYSSPTSGHLRMIFSHLTQSDGCLTAW